MKLFRIFPLAALLSVCGLLNGCFTVHTKQPRPVRAPLYYRVVTSDFEGKRIAEYVAEGEVIKTDDGFTFNAVQRKSFGPPVECYRYPLGRPITVQASNVVSLPTCKPLWLRELDHDGEGECKDVVVSGR